MQCFLGKKYAWELFSLLNKRKLADKVSGRIASLIFLSVML